MTCSNKPVPLHAHGFSSGTQTQVSSLSEVLSQFLSAGVKILERTFFQCGKQIEQISEL